MAGARPADQVWLDGRLVSASEPHLRVDDRGFQLGDGAFETLRARRGVVIELYEHLARLHDSTDALAIRLPFDDRRLIEGIRELLAAEGLDAAGDGDEPPGDAALRITVSRGPIARRGLLPAGFDTASATVAIQARPYAPPPVEVLARGVRAIVATVRRDPSSPLAGVKSTSRADYVHARLEADRAGADDALFLTTDGRLSEGTTANVFAIFERRLVTPPLGAAILGGTTRTWLLANASEPVCVCDFMPQLGTNTDIELQKRAEEDLRPADLWVADEAFLSSSVAGIVPLVTFEGRAIGDGRPGHRSLGLREAREAWIDERSRIHQGFQPPEPATTAERPGR